MIFFPSKNDRLCRVAIAKQTQLANGASENNFFLSVARRERYPQNAWPPKRSINENEKTEIWIARIGALPLLIGVFSEGKVIFSMTVEGICSVTQCRF